MKEAKCKLMGFVEKKVPEKVLRSGHIWNEPIVRKERDL